MFEDQEDQLLEIENEGGGGADGGPAGALEESGGGTGPAAADNDSLQRQFDEQIAGIGVPNPYTGKPFGSFQEFQEYGQRYKAEQLAERAKKQGKTVDELREEEENRSFLARKRQEEKEQREAVKAAQARGDFVKKDVQAFVQKFPDVDVAKLEQNAKFRKFAGDRLYRMPLSELYGDFTELVSDAERAAVEKAAGRQGRGTGGGQGGGMDMLTPSQRATLDEWNRANPEMKMSPKEFLEP